MENHSSTKIVFVSCPGMEEAKKLAHQLVKEKLAGCVQIIPKIVSIYEWKDKIEEESEVLLILKTVSSRLADLEKQVLTLHPYETPEFVAVNADHIAKGYLDWLAGLCS